MSDQPSRPSGLKNPGASVRGVGAAALASEGVVLLLAIVPLRVLAGADSAAGTLLVLGLAVFSFGLAGLLRHRWAWWGGSLLQAAIVVSGWFIHPSLVVVGLLFGLVWLYALYVRRTVLGGRSG